MKLILSKKQAEVLDYILSNAETNIVTRDELELVDRQALIVISQIREELNSLEYNRTRV